MTITTTITDDGTGSADELLAFQRLAWSSIVFSVTRRCPLSCSHCITESGPDVGTVLTRERAARWARDIPELADRGLRHVTFTGGEPVLALPAVRVLAEAASASGLHTAIVTSGAWATSARAAQHVVERLGAIAHWDLGYDVYHAEGLDWTRFENALRALADADCSYSVRVCVGEDRDSDELVERIRAACGPRARVITQPVRRLGRAAVTIGRRTEPVTSRPCVSTGPLIRDDGSVAPCCAGLAYEERATPFQFGNVDDDGLLGVWEAWRDDQLLRLMRLVGIDVPLAWLGEHTPVPGPSRGADVCETCVGAWRAHPDAIAAVRARAQHPDVRAKLDALEVELYGEVWHER